MKKKRIISLITCMLLVCLFGGVLTKAESFKIPIPWNPEEEIVAMMQEIQAVVDSIQERGKTDTGISKELPKEGYNPSFGVVEGDSGYTYYAGSLNIRGQIFHIYYTYFFRMTGFGGIVLAAYDDHGNLVYRDMSKMWLEKDNR